METPNTNKASNTDAVKKPQKRIPQSDIPVYSLKEALAIPRAIIENYGSHPSTPLQVASAVRLKPDSRHFRDLCGSSLAYGLTHGGYNAKTITIEPLAKKIITPLEEGEDIYARKEAALKPRVIGEFIHKYENSQLPRRDIAINVLIDMRVPRNRADSIFELILETAQSIGIVKEINGRQYIDLSGVQPIEDFNETESEAEEEDIDKEMPAPRASQALSVKKELGKGIFIAHGKNKKPIEQLKKILDQFKVPYKVAVDAPSS